MSYDNENKGAVWPNKDRKESTHPHWTGSATIDGVEYYVNAWKKADDASEKSPSIKFTFKPKGERAGKSKSSDSFLDDDLDNVPF